MIRPRQSLFLLLFIILFSVSMNSFAAKGRTYKVKPAGIKKMKVNLQNQKYLIKKTANEITRLEKNLNIGNKRYLRTIRKRRAIELTLFELQKNTHELSLTLDAKLKRIRINLRGILINTLGDQDTPAELLARKMMIKNLLKEKKSYEKEVIKNDQVSEKVALLTKRINEHKTIENELTNVLRNLEYKKRDKTDTYLSKVKQKDLLLSKIARVKVKSAKRLKNTNKSTVSVRFKSPIENFLKIEYKKKGVTFKYKGKHALKAAASGKVVYKGLLSNFGNVIMIDHGKQTRTIILGKFSSNVNKGNVVKTGQILGYTRGSQIKEQKIYFEVRKKNKVQNTFQLIERKSLANNQQSNDNT